MFLSLDEFSEFCVKNNIDSYDKYKSIINNNLPSYPNECYRLSGWNGWKFKKSSKLLV